MFEIMIWTMFTIASGVQISKQQNVQNKELFRKLWKYIESHKHSVRNVGNDDLNYVCYS